MGREKDDFFLHQSTKNSSSSKVQRAPGEAEGFQYVFAMLFEPKMGQNKEGSGNS